MADDSQACFEFRFSTFIFVSHFEFGYFGFYSRKKL